MKYKVGDIVKLRDDLEDGKMYGVNDFVDSMECLKNKPLEIIDKNSNGYEIKESIYDITDEMIEGLWEESYQQVKKDDKQAITGDKDTVQQVTGKLKLIDVLNKIADGELKEGTKVIHKGIKYTYRKNQSSPVGYDLYDEDNLDTLGENCFVSDITDICELIEPQEPTECEHEWEEYGMYNTKTKEVKHFRKCIKCDLEEEIEPTDNTTEKIEELRIKVFRKDYFEFRELDKGFMDNFLEININLMK